MLINLQFFREKIFVIENNMYKIYLLQLILIHVMNKSIMKKFIIINIYEAKRLG